MAGVFMSSVVMGARVQLTVTDWESIASVYGYCRSCKVGTDTKRTKDTENPR